MQTSGWLVSLLHCPGVLYFIGSIFPSQIVQKKLPEWSNLQVTSVGLIKQFMLVVYRALGFFIFFSQCLCLGYIILDVIHLPVFGYSQIYLFMLRFCYYGTYKRRQLESHG